MQQELKMEAYRMEAVRKSVETTCFERCFPAPGLAKVLSGALPEVKLGGSGSKSAFEEEVARTSKYDLSDSEALCVDRCAWKYMQTAKICLRTLAKAQHVKEQPPKM